jgi:hypothetical protein
VQGSLSLQTIGVLKQVPATQVSVVQLMPSLQSFGAKEQPKIGSHFTITVQASGATQGMSSEKQDPFVIEQPRELHLSLAGQFGYEAQESVATVQFAVLQLSPGQTRALY